MTLYVSGESSFFSFSYKERGRVKRESQAIQWHMLGRRHWFQMSRSAPSGCQQQMMGYFGLIWTTGLGFFSPWNAYFLPVRSPTSHEARICRKAPLPPPCLPCTLTASLYLCLCLCPCPCLRTRAAPSRQTLLPGLAALQVRVPVDQGENPHDSPSQAWTATTLTLESQRDSHNLFIPRCIHPSIIYLHLFYYCHYNFIKSGTGKEMGS